MKHENRVCYDSDGRAFLYERDGFWFYKLTSIDDDLGSMEDPISGRIFLPFKWLFFRNRPKTQKAPDQRCER